MQDIRCLFGFIRPYLRLSVLSLVLLGALVGLDLAIPRLIQRIIDQGISRGDHQLVVHTALLMLGVSALSALIAIGNNLFSVQVGEGVARDLRDALFLKIQSFSFGNLDRQNTGQLLVRLTSDVTALKSLAQISLRIGTRAPLMLVGSLILMVGTSPRLALVLSPLLIVTSILIGFFVLRTEPLFRGVQTKLDALNGVLQENIAGARLVKSLVRADFEAERFADANLQMTERSVAVMQFTAAMMPTLTLCINLGMVVVIWAGGMDAIAGKLSIGQIVAFTNYMLSTMTPLVMMSMLANTWAAGMASATRVREVLEAEPEVQDAAAARELPADARAHVSFEHVDFAYRGDADAVLHDVELDAAPGQTIAILGATGAGKSTLVELIPRFYDVSSGQVRFAGQDVRELKQASLLAQIAIVPQEALLFSGSVKDNIRYGNPAASDDEVVAAARAAQAHDFICKLDGGYDARVAPRGANFSGGQRQRLAIARALVLRPRVLIFDDSTSAVDVETETKIQAALAAERDGRTTFVVAQRVSTVINADKIVVLDRGRVVASGTHRELLAGSSVYQEIYASQLGGGVPQGASEAGAAS